MASPPDATLAAELAGEMDAHVAADQAACAEAAAEAAPPTKAACGKCKVEHETADMISRAGYRPDLRYVCKACNATTTTLTRKGIQVQHLLDESSMVAFFSEAALERRNAQENPHHLWADQGPPQKNNGEASHASQEGHARIRVAAFVLL